MSDPESPSDRRAVRPATTAKPSLIDGDAAKRVRVLDGLGDGAQRPGRTASASTQHRVAWPLALGFGTLVMVALWWWMRPADTATASAPGSPTWPAVPTATAPSGDASPAPAATVAAAPVEAASAARIEKAPEPRPVTSAIVAASASTRTPARTPTRTAARPSAPSHRPATTTAAAAPERRPKAAASTNGTDPDVTLLSAMLARLADESERPGGASPATIAQLVGQCERQAATSSIDAFECRRRICAGYWGKADACPMSLAPKPN